MASKCHNRTSSPSLSAQASLEALPNELLLNIFYKLPDAFSLKAFILTNSSILKVYQNQPSMIVRLVLENEVSTYSLDDATTALRSSRVLPRTKGNVQQFLAHSSNKSDDVTPHWTLLEALAISDLSKKIRFFVAAFTSYALYKLGATASISSHLMRVSADERRRIESAFYRFELYCNLFREQPCGDNRLSLDEQRDIFFARYTPWENEQLACVHDYLFRRLSVPFNDIAEHDIEWAERSIQYVDDWNGLDNPYKQGYLSLGLPYLHKIVTTKTYEQRYDLMSPALLSNENFLYEGLRTQGEDNGQPLPEYGNDAGKIYVNTLLPESEDFGPVRAWQWAHGDSSWERYYFRNDQQALRQAGYVMWDLRRISECTDIPWDVNLLWRGNIHEVWNERRRQAMYESWSERKKIFRRGGRGWWSPGDESQVRWQT